MFSVAQFKMMASPDVFFIFSKFWFSGLKRGEGFGGKGQKMAQNDKQNLSHSIPPYLSNFFFHFKILIFWVFQSLSINAKRKFWDVPHLRIFTCVRVPPPDFVYVFSRKMFLMLHSISWPNFVVWLLLLLEILDNMCITIVC